MLRMLSNCHMLLRFPIALMGFREGSSIIIYKEASFYSDLGSCFILVPQVFLNYFLVP